MSPTRIALAKVLRVWVEWPGVQDGDGELAEPLRYAGDALISGGLVVRFVEEPSAAGLALLAELDAHERTDAGAP